MTDTTRVRINNQLLERLRERLPDLDFMNTTSFVEYLLTNAISTQPEPGLQSLMPAPKADVQIEPLYENVKTETRNLSASFVSEIYEHIHPKWHDRITIIP